MRQLKLRECEENKYYLAYCQIENIVKVIVLFHVVDYQGILEIKIDNYTDNFISPHTGRYEVNNEAMASIVNMINDDDLEIFELNVEESICETI